MSQVESFTPNDISISMTDAALDYVRQQLVGSQDALGILLGVKKSGCSGFKYDLQLAKTLAGDERAFVLADDVTVYVTPEALPYINGTEIDYITSGLNSTMVFNNPNAKDQCGCGESFSV